MLGGGGLCDLAEVIREGSQVVVKVWRPWRHSSIFFQTCFFDEKKNIFYLAEVEVYFFRRGEESFRKGRGVRERTISHEERGGESR